LDTRINRLLLASTNANADNELRHGDFSVAHHVAHESGKSAVSSAVEPAAIDPDLASINAAWPTLPAAIRTGIMAMVKAVGG
jgi:hypothetical protein